MTQFERYSTSSYRNAVEQSMPAGVEWEAFTRMKAARLVDLATRLLGDPEAQKVIDVGCGMGDTDRFLNGTFEELHGVDISNQLVEAAASRNPSVSYRAAREGEPLPYPDSSFDLAFAICVVHHVPPQEWAHFVGEMARIVRSGGLVAIFEHNPRNPLTRRVVRNCAFDQDAVLLTRKEALSLLEDRSLAIVESRFIAIFPGDGTLLRAIERRIGTIPIGAQYYVAGRKT